MHAMESTVLLRLIPVGLEIKEIKLRQSALVVFLSIKFVSVPNEKVIQSLAFLNYALVMS